MQCFRQLSRFFREYLVQMVEIRKVLKFLLIWFNVFFAVVIGLKF